MVDDPIHEVWKRSLLLETALKECKTRGNAAAETEKVYRVALAKKILELREGGYPATLIGDIARGDETVANLKFERDSAQVVYDNAQDALLVYRKQIEVLRDQIEREWKNP